MCKGSRKVTFDRARDEPRSLGRREPLELGRPTAAGAAADDDSRGCFVLDGAMAQRDNGWSVRKGDLGGALNPKGQCIAYGPSFALPRRTPRKALKNYQKITSMMLMSNKVHRQALGERLEVKMWWCGLVVLALYTVFLFRILRLEYM